MSGLCEGGCAWSDFDPSREGLLHAAITCITSLGSGALPFLSPLLQGPITHALDSQDQEDCQEESQQEEADEEEEEMGSAATQEKVHHNTHTHLPWPLENHSHTERNTGWLHTTRLPPHILSSRLLPFLHTNPLASCCVLV